MRAALVCFGVVVLATSVVAQFPAMPSPTDMAISMMPKEMQGTMKAIVQIQKMISSTPLGRFMPSQTQMFSDAFKMFQAANNVQKGIENVMKSMQDNLNKAAAQAKLPTGNLEQITQQVNQIFQNAGKQAGSMLQSGAPQY